MNSALKKDLQEFLDKYYKFKIISTNNDNECILLKGVIDIIDTNQGHWESYQIGIAIPKNNYPNVTPSVIEISKIIERKWDSHISKDAICCLAIPHKLILSKRSGIKLINFYQKFIYPFFANHQYKLRTGKYANGEFEHHDKGILQFYREELETSDLLYTEKIIQIATGKLKIGNNDTCPICNKGKFKRCCKIKASKIEKYGLKQLKIDLILIKTELNRNSITQRN